jgi:glutathione synthase
LELEPAPIISELGIYGMFIRRGDRVLLNTSAGHCLRTKPASANEGGIIIGVSALDSPLLVATEEFIRDIIQSPN